VGSLYVDDRVSIVQESLKSTSVEMQFAEIIGVIGTNLSFNYSEYVPGTKLT
jgi:hypothetical protein